MSDRSLIVGLGNPTRKYRNTRHNVGFRCVDALAEQYGLSFDKKQAKAQVALGTVEEQGVILAKPQTFMNLSGESVGKLVDYYCISPAHLLIIFDDMDIPLGTLRIRKGGGTGGHNGMKSIVQRLGTQDFPRIRFGIGRPPGRLDPAAYVLRPFEGDDALLVAETVDRVLQAIRTWLTADIDTAMNQYNGIAEQAASTATEKPKAPITLSEKPEDNNTN